MDGEASQMQQAQQVKAYGCGVMVNGGCCVPGRRHLGRGERGVGGVAGWGGRGTGCPHAQQGLGGTGRQADQSGGHAGTSASVWQVQSSRVELADQRMMTLWSFLKMCDALTLVPLAV